jgi:peptide/nickel transport system permease protein
MTQLRGPIAKGLMQAMLTAWLLASLCFVFIHALPGDTAMRIAVARQGEDRATGEAAERIRREEGLDRPLLVQYATWLGRTAQGDLGHSLVTRKPVWQEIAYHGGFTLKLGLIGWLLSYALALPLGILAGFRPGGTIDRVSAALSVALSSLPSFLIGLGLISLFALSLRWLPPAGFGETRHMVLPAMTLALGLMAYSVRIIRNAVVDVRQAFFMTYARLRGLSGLNALRHHGLRNAAIPVVTFAALQFAYVVDGFVIVETLYNYPGLGELMVKALLARDIPIVMGCSLVIALLYAFVNMLADLVCLTLDPRRRTAQAGGLVA